MGNKSSTQSFPTEAVVAQAVKAINTFGPLFVRAASIATARQAAAALEGARDDAPATKEGFFLEAPPRASEPMERGWITKLGEIKKTWKRRYFVATEEADNHVVYYFEREKDAETPAKAKGAIFPCGYIVRFTTPEEDEKGREAGEFGLALEPLDRKRVWHLRFDSNEARLNWKQVLEYSALKCAPPLFPNEVAATAFADAYRRARRQLGLTGFYRLDRPAKEQLAVLVAQACETNVLAFLYNSINAATAAGDGGGSAAAGGATGGSGATGGAAATGGAGTAAGAAAGGATAITPAEAEKMRAGIDRELDRIVGHLVDAAWPCIVSRLELRMPTIDSIVGSSLASITREEETRRSEVRERTGKHLRPLAKECAAGVVPALLSALLKPLYKAHKEAIRVFWERIHDIIGLGLQEAHLRQLYRDVRWQAATLLPAFRKIRTITRGEVAEADTSDAALKLLSDLTVPLPELVALMGAVSFYEVETLFEDHLRQLIGWGIYTFVAAVERARGGVSPVECLHAVMRDMLHDSKIRQRANLLAIFKNILGPQVRTKALATAAVKEVADTSVAFNGGFSVIPFAFAESGAAAGGAAGGSAAAAGGASASSGSGSSSSTSLPAPAPVAKGKKAAAAVDAQIRAAPLSEVFVDTDWLLDDVINEQLDSVITGIIESKVAATHARLDKLPGKLGFSALAPAGLGGTA